MEAVKSDPQQKSRQMGEEIMRTGNLLASKMKSIPKHNLFEKNEIKTPPMYMGEKEKDSNNITDQYLEK